MTGTRETDNTVREPEVSQAPKAYSTPKLSEYGDFRSLTLAKGGARIDGGSGHSKV